MRFFQFSLCDRKKAFLSKKSGKKCIFVFIPKKPSKRAVNPSVFAPGAPSFAAGKVRARLNLRRLPRSAAGSLKCPKKRFGFTRAKRDKCLFCDRKASKKRKKSGYRSIIGTFASVLTFYSFLAKSGKSFAFFFLLMYN